MTTHCPTAMFSTLQATLPVTEYSLSCHSCDYSVTTHRHSSTSHHRLAVSSHLIIDHHSSLINLVYSQTIDCTHHHVIYKHDTSYCVCFCINVCALALSLVVVQSSCKEHATFTSRRSTSLSYCTILLLLFHRHNSLQKQSLGIKSG